MTIRDDPELGPVRLCVGCSEEWPFDAEFWHIKDGRLNKAWPSRCIACCAEYHAERRRQRQRIVRDNRRVPEPLPGRCGARMREHGRCGRLVGHQLGHRTTIAMETERARKRDGRAAA